MVKSFVQPSTDQSGTLYQNSCFSLRISFFNKTNLITKIILIFKKMRNNMIDLEQINLTHFIKILISALI